jgi:hypothetical protein
MKRPVKPQVAARRREVANLAHKGWTQAAIASHLKIPQGTVSRDLVAMREFWRDFPVYDFEKVRFEQLQKIDLVEAEAWAAWQRSQQQRRTAALTRGKAGEQSRSSLTDQTGDPRYLREIARCVAQRNAMIGVQPPTVPPERVKLEVPTTNVSESFRYYLMLQSVFGDPPYNPRGTLTTEHYAALVEEHKRDPYMHKLRLQKMEQENAAAQAEQASGNAEGAPAAATGTPAGQNNEQVLPEGQICAKPSP